MKTQLGLNFNLAASRQKMKLIQRTITLAGHSTTDLKNYSHLYFDQHIDTRKITNGTVGNCFLTKNQLNRLNTTSYLTDSHLLPVFASKCSGTDCIKPKKKSSGLI